MFHDHFPTKTSRCPQRCAVLRRCTVLVNSDVALGALFRRSLGAAEAVELVRRFVDAIRRIIRFKTAPAANSDHVDDEKQKLETGSKIRAAFFGRKILHR